MIKDASRIQALLGLVEKVASVSPGFVHISSEAMAELRMIDEGIRKQREVEANRPVTPAPVGDPESPNPGGTTPADGGDPIPGPTTATQPIDKEIDVGTRPPPVTAAPNGPRATPNTDSASDIDTGPRRL